MSNPSITAAQVNTALATKGAHPKPCQMCGGTSYDAVAGLHGLPLIVEPNPELGLPIGGPYGPVVAITCETCGHLELFAAKVLGLADDAKTLT